MFLIISCICSLLSLQVFEKLDSEVLESWLFSELAIFYLYSTWSIKYTRIPVHIYFHWNIYHPFQQMLRILKYYSFHAHICAQIVLYICIFLLQYLGTYLGT